MTKPTNDDSIVIYQAADGAPRIEVLFEGETVWLTQMQLAELFQTTKQNISLHIRSIFAEGELTKKATVKEYLTVQLEGSREVTRSIEHYNLDLIISLGYRVKSKVATTFRIWATARLKEYMIKGFTMDDDRLKGSGGLINLSHLPMNLQAGSPPSCMIRCRI